jgi:hypothetical protein
MLIYKLEIAFIIASKSLCLSEERVKVKRKLGFNI